jgi:hypothetical protein
MTEDEEGVVISESSQTQIRVILVFFILYLCGIALQILAYHHGHICASMALILAVRSYWHGSGKSALEFLFVSILYIIRAKLTFPIFQVIKMTVWFLFYIWEFPVQSAGANKLRFMIGLKGKLWLSRHSAITIGDDVYHFSFGYSNANTSITSFNSLHKTHMYFNWFQKFMFAPCVGLEVGNEKKQITQKLRNACGKCPDWGVVSLYFLSSNKFLTYSVLTPLRWRTWIFLGITLLLLVLQERPNDRPDHYLMIDFFHLLLTLVDTLNLDEESLTASDEEHDRGSKWGISKLVALRLLSWLFCQAQWNLANWGYAVFVGASSLLCVLVHLMLDHDSKCEKNSQYT